MSRQSKDIKLIYSCATPYHILYSISDAIVSKKKDKIPTSRILLITTYNKKEVAYLKQLADKITKENIFKKVVVKYKIRLLDYLLVNKILDFFSFFFAFNLKNMRKYELYSVIFTWNPHFLFLSSRKIFLESKFVTFIEDGSTAWQAKKPSKFEKIIKTFLFGTIAIDQIVLDKVKFIVNEKENYQKFNYFTKVKSEKIEHLFNNLSISEKKNVVNLFIDDIDMIKINISLSKKKWQSKIVFTQPLSEDNFINEKEKIKKYAEIIENEMQNQTLIYLKKHPRDNTNYSLYLKHENIIELNKNIPSELLNIMDIEFVKSIGICTSAVENSNAKIKVNLEPDFFNKF